jgi:hypothetical protein
MMAEVEEKVKGVLGIALKAAVPASEDSDD